MDFLSGRGQFELNRGATPPPLPATLSGNEPKTVSILRLEQAARSDPDSAVKTAHV